MKTTRAGIVLAALLIMFAGISQAKNGPSKPVQDCRDKNQKAIAAVETQYKGARRTTGRTGRSSMPARSGSSEEVKLSL